MKLEWLIISFLAITIYGCNSEKPKAKNIQIADKGYKIPAFNKDSAYLYVARQVNFGPRVPGMEAHQKCADWMTNKLASFGLKARQENFIARRYDGKEINGINIVASINPNEKKRVFIAAHWDSRFKADHDKERKSEPILGADDGGSGVGVCLEVARILAANKEFKMGLDIVLFDAEDQGDDEGDNPDSWGIGAQKWSNKNKAQYDPEYGILLDMVGSKEARYYQEKWSLQTAPKIVNKVWKVAQTLGYGHVFLQQEGRGVVDDHYFVNRNTGWPMIDIIHTKTGSGTGFVKHWHTHDDDMDVIDENMLGIVGKVLTTTLCYEDLNKI